MAWRLESNHAFSGIAEKLKRSKESIVSLNAEIDSFIQSGAYPILPNPDSAEWKEAVSYHRTKRIPLRFSVLTGEIVHHLRSCLDHVVWHFSDTESRIGDPNGIEYPIFEKRPRNHREQKNYSRKVQGIKQPRILELIEASQPYNEVSDVADNLLLILHDMDRFDKHRELTIADSKAIVSLRPSLTELYVKLNERGSDELSEFERGHLIRIAQRHGNVKPGVGFKKFGKTSPFPLIKGLLELTKEVEQLLDSFADEA